LALIGAAATFLVLAGPGSVVGHEVRQVGDYQFVVGFIDEPVFAGQKSGLEFLVTMNDEPVEGLEEVLAAEVIFGDERRDLPLEPRFGEPGWYQSHFFPTVDGQYAFHITGTIDGTPLDETFTSGPDTFGDPQAVAGGQFPVVFPPMSDVVAQAEQGAQAATQVTIALILGVTGAVLGLLALGVALAGRRRA
jgi:hypothetical protein